MFMCGIVRTFLTVACPRPAQLSTAVTEFRVLCVRAMPGSSSCLRFSLGCAPPLVAAPLDLPLLPFSAGSDTAPAIRIRSSTARSIRGAVLRPCEYSMTHRYCPRNAAANISLQQIIPLNGNCICAGRGPNACAFTSNIIF